MTILYEMILEGGRKQKNKNTSNCGSRFSSTGGKPVIISSKTWKKKNKSEENALILNVETVQRIRRGT